MEDLWASLMIKSPFSPYTSVGVGSVQRGCNSASCLGFRELGEHFKVDRPPKQLQWAAEESLIDSKRVYTESICSLPETTRATFLMVFSPDGKLIASTHGDHNVYITCLTQGKVVRTLKGHPRTPWSIAFHPSSNQILASGCLGGHVRVWDLHGGSEVWVSESLTVIASLAFHPLQRILAIASYNEIHFWDWSSDTPFAKSQTNSDKEKVRYVSFDHSGNKLITGVANVTNRRIEWDRVWSSSPPHHQPPPPPTPPPPPPPPMSYPYWQQRVNSDNNSSLGGVDDDVDDDQPRPVPLRYECLTRRFRELRDYRRDAHNLWENGDWRSRRGGNSSVLAGTDEVTASLSSSHALGGHNSHFGRNANLPGSSRSSRRSTTSMGPGELRELVSRLTSLRSYVRAAYSEIGGTGDGVEEVARVVDSPPVRPPPPVQRVMHVLASGLGRLREINRLLSMMELDSVTSPPPPSTSEPSDGANSGFSNGRDTSVEMNTLLSVERYFLSRIEEQERLSDSEGRRRSGGSTHRDDFFESESSERRLHSRLSSLLHFPPSRVDQITDLNVRLGMRLVARHIENISRLCRVRFEIVQLRQVRQLWDDLQRSLLDLQRSLTESGNSRRPSGGSCGSGGESTSSERQTVSSRSSSPARDVRTTAEGASSSVGGSNQSATSSSGVDSEGGDSSGSSSRPPLLSFRRPARSSPSKRMRFECQIRSTPARLMRFRSGRLIPDRPCVVYRGSGRSLSRGSMASPSSSTSVHPSSLPSSSLIPHSSSSLHTTLDTNSDEEEEEESSSATTCSPSPSGSRRKRSRPIQGPSCSGGGSVGTGSGSGSGLASSSGTGRCSPARARLAITRFYGWRSLSPASPAFSAHHHRLLPSRSTGSRISSRDPVLPPQPTSSQFPPPPCRDQTSQTRPTMSDASVGTEARGSPGETRSLLRLFYGRLRARRSLMQMIESLMDFLENDTFTRNLPANILHRRIMCLYNLLQRALELTLNLLVQMSPAVEERLLRGDDTPEIRTNLSGPRIGSPGGVFDPFVRRTPNNNTPATPLTPQYRFTGVSARSHNSSTASPPSSSSSSGNEGVTGSGSGRIPTLRVNDGPPPAENEPGNVRPLPRSFLHNSGISSLSSSSSRLYPLSPTIDGDSDDSSPPPPPPPVYFDSSMLIRYHSMGLTHRIQAWDFSSCKVPDLSLSESNVVVNECRVHNDASVDISKDGKLLVALLPSSPGGPTSNTNMLGIYSLEWSTLGQCLYRTVCLQNAVSVSLSPTSRHLVVGLASRRTLITLNFPHYLAQVCKLSGGEARRGGEKVGSLLFVREIKVPAEAEAFSVNCIRWIPTAGSGFVYGTNTGQLKILR